MARVAGLLAADGPGSTAAPKARERVEDHALGWYQERWSRPASRSDGPRSAPREAHLARLKNARPAEHRAPVGRAMPASPRVRRAGAAAWCDVRDVALRRAGRAACGYFGLADLFGVSSTALPPRRRADAERLPAASRAEPPYRPPAPTPCRVGRRAPRDPRTGRLEVTPRVEFRRPAADPHPELPRPADGDGLPARAETDVAPRRSCCEVGAGRVAYLPPGTSTASVWEVLAVDHGRLLGELLYGGSTRGPARRGRGPGVLEA